MGFSDMKYSFKDVAAALAVEGIEYGVCSYLTLKGIQDDELRKVCIELKSNVEKIEKILEEQVGEDWRG